MESGDIRYLSFKTENEAVSWANKYFSDWLPGLIDKDIRSENNIESAIKNYCGSSHVPVNRMLRSDRCNNIEYKEYLEGIDILKNEINKYELQDNILVYRFVTSNFLKSLCNSKIPRKNQMITDKGFMSTSLLYSSMNNFRQHRKCDCVLAIRLPKGTKGVYTGFLSHSLKEFEFILAPNTTIKILKKHLLKNRDGLIEFECILS